MFVLLHHLSIILRAQFRLTVRAVLTHFVAYSLILALVRKLLLFDFQRAKFTVIEPSGLQDHCFCLLSARLLISGRVKASALPLPVSPKLTKLNES